YQGGRASPPDRGSIATTSAGAAALAAFDPATVHEAQGRTGALPSVIKPVDPGFRLCGPAFTVVCPGGDNLWLHRAIYAAEPGDVLVVGTGGHLEAGHWGEVMSHAAVARRLGGLVIDGGVRDAQCIARLGFPVFSAGICIRGTDKDPAGHGSLGEPLRLGDVTVHPGDIVLGDRDGLVVVPAAGAAAVADAAGRRVAAEEDVIRRLQSGESTLSIYDLP
ncbi:MAG: RraA family protein, partial [Acidimicrobiia bacterium]